MKRGSDLENLVELERNFDTWRISSMTVRYVWERIYLKLSQALNFFE